MLYVLKNISPSARAAVERLQWDLLELRPQQVRMPGSFKASEQQVVGVRPPADPYKIGHYSDWCFVLTGGEDDTHNRCDLTTFYEIKELQTRFREAFWGLDVQVLSPSLGFVDHEGGDYHFDAGDQTVLVTERNPVYIRQIGITPRNRFYKRWLNGRFGFYREKRERYLCLDINPFSFAFDTASNRRQIELRDLIKLRAKSRCYSVGDELIARFESIWPYSRSTEVYLLLAHGVEAYTPSPEELERSPAEEEYLLGRDLERMCRELRLNPHDPFAQNLFRAREGLKLRFEKVWALKDGRITALTADEVARYYDFNPLRGWDTGKYHSAHRETAAELVALIERRAAEMPSIVSEILGSMNDPTGS